MTLNSTGPISLGGPTAGQSIAVEIQQSPTGQISLNDTNVRSLAGVPSGQISMPDNFYGKSWRANSAYFFMMGGGGISGSGAGYGGGGGGQMLGQNTGVSVTGLSGTYTVTVGAAGSNSSVFGYTAVAGGTGGSYAGEGAGSCSSTSTGGNGACGGGGSIGLIPAFGCSGGSPTVAGGTSGGSGYAAPFGGIATQAGGGGGGGLGGGGGSANGSGQFSGNGGLSTTSTFNISNSAIHYGGGAPGAIATGSGTGGVYDGYQGVNTGYGGYSGVVIIRISNAFIPPSATVTPVNSGGYYWYAFTSSGSITF